MPPSFPCFPTHPRDGSQESEDETSNAASIEPHPGYYHGLHRGLSMGENFNSESSETTDEDRLDTSDDSLSSEDAVSQASGVAAPVDREVEAAEILAELWSVREVTEKPATDSGANRAEDNGVSPQFDGIAFGRPGGSGQARAGEAAFVLNSVADSLELESDSLRLHIIESSDPFHHFGIPTVPKYFEIKKSPLGGLGVFALRDLEEDDKIWVEQAMLKADWEKFGDGYDSLTAEQKDIFDQMHANFEYEDQWKAFAIWKTNNFLIKDNQAGFFPVAARFNHACKPMNTVCYWYDSQKDVLTFVLNKDVKAGTELTISYSPEGPQALYKRWGFVCQCGACASLSDAEKVKIDSKDGWSFW